VFHRRVKKVVVSAEAPVPVQIDGDPGGYVFPSSGEPPRNGAIDLHEEQTGGSDATSDQCGEWTIEVLPGALGVIAGADRRASPGRSPLASGALAR
jgi:hypothetical protein